MILGVVCCWVLKICIVIINIFKLDSLLCRHKIYVGAFYLSERFLNSVFRCVTLSQGLHNYFAHIFWMAEGFYSQYTIHLYRISSLNLTYFFWFESICLKRERDMWSSLMAGKFFRLAKENTVIRNWCMRHTLAETFVNFMHTSRNNEEEREFEPEFTFCTDFAFLTHFERNRSSFSSN